MFKRNNKQSNLNLFQLSRIYNCLKIASCSIHGTFIHNFKIILCISWQYKGIRVEKDMNTKDHTQMDQEY